MRFLRPFFACLLALAAGGISAQNYILRARDEQAFTGQEILYTLTLEGVQSADVSVEMPSAPGNVSILSIQKSPARAQDGTNACYIEAIVRAETPGILTLPALTVKIGADVLLLVPFERVPVMEDPRLVLPKVSMMLDGVLTVPRVGATIPFVLTGANMGDTADITWDLPQDAAWALASKERQGPILARFTWTPLKTGLLDIPQIAVRTTTPAGEPFVAHSAPLHIPVEPALDAKDRPAPPQPETPMTAIAPTAPTVPVAVNRPLAEEYARLLRAERRSWPWSSTRTTRQAFEAAHDLPQKSAGASLPLCITLASLTLLAAVFFVLSVHRRKKRAALFALTLLAACGTLKAAADLRTLDAVFVGGNLLGVPEESASVAAAIPSGSRVQVLRKTAAWCYIGHTGVTGWVKSADLVL